MHAELLLLLLTNIPPILLLLQLLLLLLVVADSKNSGGIMKALDWALVDKWFEEGWNMSLEELRDRIDGKAQRNCTNTTSTATQIQSFIHRILSLHTVNIEQNYINHHQS